MWTAVRLPITLVLAVSNANDNFNHKVENIMAGRLTLVFNDYDGNTIQQSFDGTVVANDGTNFAAQKALADSLETAILAVTLGNLVSDNFGEHVTTQNGLPLNPSAQTNIQWQCLYSDTVDGKQYTQRIGTASLDPSFVVKAGNETTVDLTSTEGAALKTAFEAFVLSPEGNAITLDQVRYVQ